MRYIVFTIIFLFVAIGSFSPTSMTRAQVPTCGVPINISQDPQLDDRFSMVDGNHVMWGKDGRVMLYDIPTATTTQVGYGNYRDMADNYVVWQDANEDIQFYDISTGIVANITQDNTFDYGPQTDGVYVVWHRTVPLTIGYDYEIWAYNFSTGTQGNISQFLAEEDFLPKVHGDHIIWRRNATYDELWLHKISTGTDTLIDGNIAVLWGYEVQNNYVVWSASNNLMRDNYLYDISSGVTTNLSQVTGQVRARDPRIDGNYIVWRQGDASYEDIWLYDIATASKINITQSSDINHYADVDGNYVVWSMTPDIVSPIEEVWLYDISTGEQLNISQHPDLEDHTPRIDGNYVTWVSWDHLPAPNDDYEVWLYRICPPVQPPPPPINITPVFTKSGELQAGDVGLVGDQIVWTITLTTPQDLNNVVITDTLPAGLQIDDVTTTHGTVSVGGQTVTVNVGTLSAGSTLTIQVFTTIIDIPDDGFFENIANMRADNIALSASARILIPEALPQTGYPPHE